MIIKVLGTGCTKCHKLEELALRAVAELGLDARVEKVTEFADIVSYGVMSTPALVVDEEVRLAGRVPPLEDLKQLLSR